MIAKTILLPVFAALVALPTRADQRMSAAGRSDQIPTRVAAAPAPAAAIEPAAVNFAWTLDPLQPLEEAPPPFMASSRSYWQIADATTLRQGLPLPLTAPGALVQISPLQGALALASAQWQVRDPSGTPVIDTRVDAAALRAAGMAVAAGTSVVKLGAASGRGRYRLQGTRAQGRYVVQVQEAESTVALQLQASRQQVLAGDMLTLTARLVDDGGNAATATPQAGARALAATGQALLVAPGGRSWVVPLVAAGDGLHGQVRIPQDVGPFQGLWELQADVVGKGVQRVARVAVAVAQPTARFTGQFNADPAARRIRLAVQLGAPGRYEARGTLYATAPDGVLRAAAQAHAAASFAGAGQGSLTLDFASATLPAGYAAPFEVRQLELHDQSRMAPLERRVRALRF